MFPLVTAYTLGSGIHKADACTCSQQYGFDEYGQGEQYFLFQFHKSIVGYPPWKQMCQMLADIFQIEMFEASVAAGMKKNHDEDDFRIAHTIGLVSMFPVLCRGGEHVIFLIFRKFFAEIVCQTKNFSNFILGEQSGNGLNVIIEHYKFNQIIAILQIFKKLFISFISNSR